jgi:hypothetical protein
MKRYQVKDRGVDFGRFPSAHLYALYKVPTKAGRHSMYAMA